MKARGALLIALGFSLLSGPLPHAGHHAHAQEMPVSYICTMDPDVLEDKPGICPICQMALQPVRIEQGFSCITHPIIIAAQPGFCRFDKRPLVPINVAHFFDCGEKPEKYYAEGGRCPDGSPRKERREVRAHGDHNPRHGGQFFMASDKWHHIEGTHPQAGLFRMYFYDNFTKPLALKGITGRAIVRDAANKDVATVEMRPSRDGMTLDAPLKVDTLPLKVHARIRFNKTTEEQGFDFTFPEYSRDVPAPSPTAISGRANIVTPSPSAAPKPQAAARPESPAPATVVQREPPPPSGPPPAPSTPPPDPAEQPAQTPPIASQTPGGSLEIMPSTIQQEETLPPTAPELLALLAQRGQEAETLIKDGLFAQVYIPALSGKNVALALESFVGSLPNRQRVLASDALRRAVLAAWKLDMAGDIGNRDDLLRAYGLFAAAINDIQAAYGTR
jgi:hypothetical protein